jgi:hypothetical protein
VIARTAKTAVSLISQAIIEPIAYPDHIELIGGRSRVGGTILFTLTSAYEMITLEATTIRNVTIYREYFMED